MRRIFLIAGEASGDKLGAALMRGLKSCRSELQFSGIGGGLMQAEGMVSQFPMQELSVMGLAEILPKYRHLKRRIRETAAAVLAENPDVLVTIDSPDFCLRVAKIVKAANPAQRIVHYVAPSVWAWRPKRAVKMAALVDQVLALLPFEPPYMEAAGVTCDFVGHPVVAEPVPTPEDITRFREKYNISDSHSLFLMLPGSRKGEVSRLAPIFGAVLGQLENVTPLVVAAAGVEEMIAEVTDAWSQRPVILSQTRSGAAFQSHKRAAFAAADAALAASGTVSLELAAAATPMVIAYKMNPLTQFIMARMALIDTVTLVNLVSETRAVPEFLGKRCRASLIAPAVEEILQGAPEQDRAMALTLERLGKGGDDPGLRAAKAILSRLPPHQ